MNFFSYIRSWFQWATQVFVDAALGCYGLSWPLETFGNFLGDVFNSLSDFTAQVAGYLWEASNWLEDTVDLLREILNWDAIKSYIRSWLYGIESAIAWFFDWWYQVGQRIETWWSGVQTLVQDWISVATQGFDELKAAWGNFWNETLPDIFSQFEILRANWSQFWSITFPTLVSFTWLTTWWNSRVQDVQDLIESAFTLRESLWEGWQELKDQVIELFADPEEWLLDKIEQMLARFW